MILGDADPRLVLVARQLETTPKAIREYPTADSFRVRPESTYENLNFPLEVSRLDSDWLEIIDATSHHRLRFRAAVGRHGFLLGLEGVTLDDGPWPRDWSLVPGDDPPGDELMTLPSLEESERFQVGARQQLSSWLEVDVPKQMTFYPPAPTAMIAAREIELGAPLPTSFRTFLGIADGFDARPFRLHGYRDVSQIDDPNLPLVLLASDSDDKDEFLVAASLAGDERIYRIDIHVAEPKPVEIAPDFRAYLRRRIVE
jgi:hypothetical protein